MRALNESPLSKQLNHQTKPQKTIKNRKGNYLQMFPLKKETFSQWFW